MLAVETGGFLKNADDVGELVVGVHGGKPVYLREVASGERRRRPAAAPCLVHAGRR
jgi:multidrug efflux pump subunit AcrB